MVIMIGLSDCGQELGGTVTRIRLVSVHAARQSPPGGGRALRRRAPLGPCYLSESPCWGAVGAKYRGSRHLGAKQITNHV